MPALTVSRELSVLPAVMAGTPAAGFRLGETLDLGHRIDTNDLGDRYPLAGPAASATPTVVTLLRPSSVSNARQALIIRLHTEIADKLANTPHWATGSDLRGIPFWIGLVRDDGGAQRVAVGEVDLPAYGFYSLDDIVTSYWADFWSLPVDRRLAFVRSLLRTVAALDDLNFIHGAIDASSILLHPHQDAVALTSVGSGALVTTGRPHVCSVGSASDFLAPELIDPAGPRPELAGVTTDRWAIGMAIFYLLFGAHPLYFLPDLGRRTIESYLRANTWPAVPPAVIASGSTAVEFVQAVDTIWAQLPGQVRFLMAQLVESGWAAPSRRPDVRTWVAAFGVPLAPPTFSHVTVTPSVVIEGGEVAIRWETADAHDVEIVGIGRFPPTGDTRVPMHASRHLELRARGPLGTATQITRRIDVMSMGDISVSSVAPTAMSSATTDDRDEIVTESGLPDRDTGSSALLGEMMFNAPPGGMRLFDPEPLGLTPPQPGSATPTTPPASGATSASTPPAAKRFRKPWKRNPRSHRP